MRVAVILLACFTALSLAQFHDVDVGGLPQRGLPIPLRTTRFQRLPASRPAAPTQAIFANQRVRRPITFKPKGVEDAIGPTAFQTGRTTKPGLPPLPSQIPIKPVNEEPEEEDFGRDHDIHDDDRDISQEQEDSQEISEENVSRAISNLGAVGSTGAVRNSGNYGNSALNQQTGVQYRPVQGTAPSGRGGNVPQPVPVQYRPAQKPNKPRKPIEENYRQQAKPIPKPVKSSQAYDSRGKKPVAQIIRRYRNDNSDGSITWGFENDDGSYKEEIIGTDCITRGKYGYIDPDGIHREYTYETGIKCDEEQREEDEENGFVDYQENKLVLPDGKTIDLSTMGKKQARRPRPIYGN